MGVSDPQYEPLEFASLAGVDMAMIPGGTLEASLARLAEVSKASADALAAWPFERAAMPAPVMACLDSLVIWRAAWLAYQESPGEDKVARGLARDLLAAADVADDDLADLVDALIVWRQSEYPRYARAQTRRAADLAAMQPKQRPGIDPGAPPSGKARGTKSRGASAD